MRRTAFIQLCLVLTIVAVVSAVGIRIYKDPAGGMGGDTFALMSPAFFGMAAKRASHLGKVASFLAMVGLLFGAAALWAALNTKAAG